MGLGRQAKRLDPAQLQALWRYVSGTREARRNRVIVLLSFVAGLRAKEIGALRWRMVLSADGAIADALALEDVASKGRSGRAIPMRRELQAALLALLPADAGPDEFVLRFRKGARALPQRADTVRKLFRTWYRALRLTGCSSHSGRRSFGTAGARVAKQHGASARDIQELLGHEDLSTTQKYIDTEAPLRRKIVNGLWKGVQFR